MMDIETEELTWKTALTRCRVEELMYYLMEARDDPDQPNNADSDILLDHIRALKELLYVKDAFIEAQKIGKADELDRIYKVDPPEVRRK